MDKVQIKEDPDIKGIGLELEANHIYILKMILEQQVFLFCKDYLKARTKNRRVSWSHIMIMF